jgi:hypothetical protein
MGNNWPQFAIIIFFLLFSAISWTVRKLKEQNEVKRAREMTEAREREILRTGRDPNAEPMPDLTPPSQQVRPEPVLSPGADRRQLAAEQARAELRRLRQMRSPGAPMHAPGVGGASQQQPMSPTAAGPAPIRTELWPGGPVIEITPNAGANQPVPPPMPAQRPQQQQQRQQPMARPSVAAPPRRQPTQAQRAQAQQRNNVDREERAERARKQKALAAKREKESRELARDAREDAEELQRAGLTPVGNQPVNLHLPKTPEQWRSALILNEILGQPLGMRRNQAGDLL